MAVSLVFTAHFDLTSLLLSEVFKQSCCNEIHTVTSQTVIRGEETELECQNMEKEIFLQGDWTSYSSHLLSLSKVIQFHPPLNPVVTSWYSKVHKKLLMNRVFFYYLTKRNVLQFKYEGETNKAMSRSFFFNPTGSGWRSRNSPYLWRQSETVKYM